MSARGISIEAYHKILASGKAASQWARIYHALLRRKEQGQHGVTRSEISSGLNMRLSSVCGRVNELINAGLIKEGDRRQCAVTKEPAHPIEVK